MTTYALIPKLFYTNKRATSDTLYHFPVEPAQKQPSTRVKNTAPSSIRSSAPNFYLKLDNALSQQEENAQFEYIDIDVTEKPHSLEVDRKRSDSGVSGIESKNSIPLVKSPSSNSLSSTSTSFSTPGDDDVGPSPDHIVHHQDKKTPANKPMTAEEISAATATRQASKACSQYAQLAAIPAQGVTLKPHATQEQDNSPVEISAGVGAAASSASILEATVGVATAVIQLRNGNKNLAEANKKINSPKSGSLEKKNAEATKESILRDRKLHASVAIRFSFSGLLNFLRIGKYAGAAQNGSTTALSALGKVITVMVPPIALFAAGIVIYNAYTEWKNIKKAQKNTGKIDALRNPKATANSSRTTEIDNELSVILTSIKKHQSLNTKKSWFWTNLLSASGYIVSALGGSLTLAYTFGAVGSVAAAASMITPVGWGLAGTAAFIGAGLAIYRYVKHRQHRIEKHTLEKTISQSTNPNEKYQAQLKLLEVSSSYAINRLFAIAKNANDPVSRAKARKILDKLVGKEQLNLLLTSDEKEAFAFTGRSVNFKVKAKKMENFSALPKNNMSYSSSLV